MNFIFILQENPDQDLKAENPTAQLHSRRLSSSFEAAAVSMNSTDQESPKIVEVDTGSRPKSRSRRAHSWMPDSGEAISSPFPVRITTSNLSDQEWGLNGDEWHFSTAQSTPRFTGPVTPAKSVTETYLRSWNYMAKTQSFEAKVRSQSAPKQRPEGVGTPRKKVMESRSSLSGVRMQRSCSQAQQAINFKNAVMGKLQRSSDFLRESSTHFYPNID